MPSCPRCGGFVKREDRDCPRCSFRADFAAIAVEEDRRRQKLFGKGGDEGAGLDEPTTDATPLVEPIRWTSTGANLTNALKAHLYEHNPFRILGLEPDATIRQIDQRSRAIRVGAISKIDDPLVDLYAPPSSQAAESAAVNLHDPINRFFAWVFWFWAKGPAGSLDLASLHDSTILTHAQALTPYSGNSAMKRRPSLPLEILLWDKVMDGWQHLLSKEVFLEELRRKAQELDDPRLTDEAVASIVSTLPAALLCLNGELAVHSARTGDLKRANMHADIVKSFFCDQDQRAAAEASVAGARSQLRQVVAEAGKGSSDPRDLAHACNDLLSEAEEPLQVLDLIMPKDHPAIEHHHDAVATKALDMIITYGNNTADWRIAFEVLSSVMEVSRGSEARERVSRNRLITWQNMGRR